jgi:hypothetical protein
MGKENGAPVVRKSGVWLKRLARISSWALFASVFVLVLSGWGITQTGVIHNITFGLIDRRLANEIHRAAILPMVFFFLSHVFINISLSLAGKRSYIKQAVNWVLVAIGICAVGLVIYMEYFRLGG